MGSRLRGNDTELGSRLRGNDTELGSRLRGNDTELGSRLRGNDAILDNLFRGSRMGEPIFLTRIEQPDSIPWSDRALYLLNQLL